MKIMRIAALCAVLLSACAGPRHATPPDRSHELLHEANGTRVTRDHSAARGNAESLRVKRIHLQSEPNEEDSEEIFPPVVRLAASWVCEVEGSSKIFTGIGSTREEALGSARASCGSHIRASYCNKADCKQAFIN